MFFLRPSPSPFLFVQLKTSKQFDETFIFRNSGLGAGRLEVLR